MSGSNINLLTPNFFFGGTNASISGSGGNIKISGSNITLSTPNFFLGSTNTFISGSGGNIAISSSNFSINASGSVTASNIDISGVSRANIIQNKSVTITTANSSSYLQLIPEGGVDIFDFTPAYYVLRLDGALGGNIVQRVVITCAFPLKYSSAYTDSYRIAIGGIQLPLIADGQAATAIVEVNGSGISFRDDVGGFSSPVNYQ
jgi:hypothetical protein